MQHVSSWLGRAWPVAGGLALAGLLAGTARAQTCSFAPVVRYGAPATGYAYGFAVADLNGDGQPDLVRALSGTNQVGVLLGLGGGTFSGTMVTYAAGPGSSQPVAVAVADLNGDGRPDVVTANSGTDDVGVLLGTGTGTFGAAQTYWLDGNSSPIDVTVADVTGDGRLDLVTASQASNSVSVLPGTGTGTFGASQTYSAGIGSGPSAVVTADVNGDGRRDLLTANFFSSTVGVLLGNSTGAFEAVQAFPAGPGSQPSYLAVADVTGDGYPDVLTANRGSNTAGVLPGTSTGSFGTVRTYPAGANGRPYSIAAADVNGDGRRDLVVANYGGPVGVLLSTGAGTFGATQPFYTGVYDFVMGLVVADVSGDGRPDLLTTFSGGNGAVGVLLNTTPLATAAALPDATATLAPNPARAGSTLTTTGLPAGAAQLTATLHDALGRELRRLVVPAAAGAARAEVPTAGLPAGVYLLRLAALDARGERLGTLPAQRLAVE